MNRLEIRTTLLKRVADQGGIRTTVPEANRYIDDGYSDICERTGAVTRVATLTCGTNEHFIALPDNCVYPITMRDVETGLPIDFVDWPWIDQDDRYFIRHTATRPRVAASWGLAELLIHPAYSSAGEMELTYAAMPDPLTESQEPELPLQHHLALVHYGHYRVLLKDAHGDISGPRLGRARRQHATYLHMAGLVAKWAHDRHGIMRRQVGQDTRRHVEPGTTLEPTSDIFVWPVV